MQRTLSAEQQRLRDSEERKADWKAWGPYLAERAWGTVREDYSATGEAWEHFPHDHARSRAYRWNEDGLGGFCGRLQNICLGVGLWNGRNPILKERLFGLSGNEGNHGEDVKEEYFYLDGVPSHAYMKMLYKYPQLEYPYADLVNKNRSRGRQAPEYELLDALGEAFSTGLYFDVFIEYAKLDEQDIVCRITAHNRGPDPAPLHILPQLWYRNTWSWGHGRSRPALELQQPPTANAACAHARARHLGDRWWYAERAGQAAPTLLFTENDTNHERLWGSPNSSPFVKDAFHRLLIEGDKAAVNPQGRGTKVAAHFESLVSPGEPLTISVRFSPSEQAQPFAEFDDVLARRIAESDEFHAGIRSPSLDDDEANIHRQAMAGLLWSKQYYHYAVKLWLDGDPAGPKPPEARKRGRNSQWRHVYNLDVLSMPDKWEYPWYAAWDLAFHCLPIAAMDPEWAKRQLVLLLREWYMHPNGQLPAYEWALGDVNPPVHAWAAWRVYKIARNVTGVADTVFLERVFHKLLLNFTWWVNRTDSDGRNIFQGGFLGLDNIGVFDRSQPLPTGGHLEQADGTAWMGMYCLNMLAIALELARTRPAYEDVATKFFEHFIYIANAINRDCGDHGLWDEQDGFYYDQIHTPNGQSFPIKIRSLVGLIPLFAVETLEPDLLELLPRFRRRMEWFIQYRPELVSRIASLTEPGLGGRRLLSLVDSTQLRRALEAMLDEQRFLGDHGLRSLSREHRDKPYRLEVNGDVHTVRYDPAESTSGLFGGNSNWRGPIWFPLNHLMIESLQKYHHYYGNDFTVEMPHGSGTPHSLEAVASELSRRLVSLFTRNPEGKRPYLGPDHGFRQTDPHWKDNILFHEYFHGDDGRGLGASHQTGWTALVARLIQQRATRRT